MTCSLLGKPVRRKEDLRLITGAGSYIDDIKLPGMLYAAFLRSPYAHGKIMKIDVTQALRYHGVKLALTGDDIFGLVKPLPVDSYPKRLKVPKHYPMAYQRVRYMGEPVAAIVASDPYSARDALELVELDVEPLPVSIDPEKAAQTEATLLHEDLGDNIGYTYRREGGDVEGSFKQADLVLSETFRIQRLAPIAIESRGVIANYEGPSGFLTVWTSTQIPFIVRKHLADALGFPANLIRVIAPEVGGGFGSKLNFYGEEVIVSLLAMKLRKPVKWIEDRRENLLSTIHGRDQIHHVEVAVRKDGTILALKDKIYADMGAYYQLSTPFVPTLTVRMLLGCYKITNCYFDCSMVLTNKMATDAYRGAGRPEATYIIERIVDIVATELKMDPADVRFRNFIQPHEFPYKTPTGLEYDSGNYPESLRKALEIIQYDKFRREQTELRKGGRYAGIGISSYVEICGIGPTIYESASVRVDPSGKITVLTGTSPHGQGHETAFAQLCVTELGVDYDDVVVLHGDTAIVPFGEGTFGSRSAVIGGTALLLSLRKIRDKLVRIAAHELKANPEEVEYQEARAFQKSNPENTLTFAQLAEAAYDVSKLPKDLEPGLEAMSFFDPANYTYPFGTHAATVEVDVETGFVKLLRYISVDDCGRVINPILVEGQIHGGVAQGVAQALLEEMVYNEEGQLLTST